MLRWYESCCGLKARRIFRMNSSLSSEVLIIIENQKVYPEALNFTREFSLRINAGITFLMLVKSLSGSHLLGERRNAQKRIHAGYNRIRNDFSEYFGQKGLKINSALRIGDPAEELLTFLADRPPFQAIIWGSGETLPFSGTGSRMHWLQRVTMSLECPLLTVKKRVT